MVQLAASFTTQPSTRAAKIVACPFVDSCPLGTILDDVPHDLLRYACSPGLARPANTPEHASPAYSADLHQASMAVLTQSGTGTVRMCRPLPTKSTMAQ